MVTQSKPPKLSSAAKQLRQDLKSATPKQAFMLRLVNPDEHLELATYEYCFQGKKLLVAVANLHDSGSERFWRRWALSYPPEEDSALLALRDQLRDVWGGATSWAEEKRRRQIIQEWMLWRPQDADSSYFPWSPDLRSGRWIPDFQNLRAHLATAALEHFSRFRTCENPDCVAAFFLAKRRTQRFCEQGECTRFAQNQYALKWWREKHSVEEGTTTSQKKARTRRGTKEAR